MRRRRVSIHFISGLFLIYSLVDTTEAKIDPLLESQFAAGRLYASISSRPGQSGRADGYILEGKELEVNLLSSVMVIRSQYLPRSPVLSQEDPNRKAEARSRLIAISVCHFVCAVGSDWWLGQKQRSDNISLYEKSCRLCRNMLCPISLCSRLGYVE